MKVLYINSMSADYVQDLTYSGLCKVLGKGNVIDYKWNKKYHIPYKSYPRNLGYVSNSIKSSIVSRFPFKFDVVFVGSAKIDCFESYLEIIDNIPINIPVIFIDGGDYLDIGSDLKNYGSYELYETAITKRKFDLVFKREYILGRDYGDSVYPLPISFNYDQYKSKKVNLEYDVTFWAVESHPIRTAALDIISNKFDCNSNGTERNQNFKKYKRKGVFYLQELSRCKIVLNYRGVGWDTLRYWEVPALGRFMITQKPGILIPDNFIQHEHVVYCRDDLSDLIDLCDYYLKNEKERERIARNSLAHVKKYHTDIARAEYILEKIKPKL